MRVIQLQDQTGRLIRFGRIKPFKNICKVTGVEELCNIVTEYQVGGVKLLILSIIGSTLIGLSMN